MARLSLLLLCAGLGTTPIWTSSLSDGFPDPICTHCEGVTHYAADVASAGDVNGDGYADVIVGAPQFGHAHDGRVFVFHGSAAGLGAAPAWTFDGSQLLAVLGFRVAAAGDVNGDGFGDVVVAELALEDLFGSNPWRVFVFHGSAAGLPATPSTVFTSVDRNEGLGPSTAVGAGDVNGDGFDDVLVGAPSANGNTGRIYLHLGSAAGIHAVPDWTHDGDAAPGSAFGWAVAAAGDVNGDGFADLLAGAPAFGGHGKAYVYFGTPYGPASTPGWTSTGDAQAGARYGESVAGAGDVAVGAPGTGKAYVYRGSAGGPSLAADWTSEGDGQPDAGFGSRVAFIGDVDGDGDDELAVGAPLFDGPAVDAGQAYVYLGSPAGLSATAAWSAGGDGIAEDYFGAAVSGAGDVDGDGLADLIVGAPGFNDGTGKAYVYGGAAAASEAGAASRGSGGGSCGLLGLETLVLLMMVRSRR